VGFGLLVSLVVGSIRSKSVRRSCAAFEPFEPLGGTAVAVLVTLLPVKIGALLETGWVDFAVDGGIFGLWYKDCEGGKSAVGGSRLYQ
jgi:hypothetical protein